MSGAKSRSSVIPVIGLEFVDLDALAFVERWSGECHHLCDVGHRLPPGLSVVWDRSQQGIVRGCWIIETENIFVDGCADVLLSCIDALYYRDSMHFRTQEAIVRYSRRETAVEEGSDGVTCRTTWMVMRRKSKVCARCAV